MAALILKTLIDPGSVPLRSLPDNSRDLLIAAQNSWCLSYNNLSKLSDSYSDDFCRLSTGGGSAYRALYTDGDEIIRAVTKPIVLNGIPSLATRLDLIERAISITLLATLA